MTDTAQKITLPKWYDLHVHFRQGPAMRDYIKAHLAMGCVGALAMPNTKPPVGKIFQADPLPYWSIEEYRAMMSSHGGDAFDVVIVPLYLTRDTTPDMIEKGAKSGLLKACKYYPPHGTTNSDHGCGIDTYIGNGVFKAMERHGIILCVHGEQHGLQGADYFDLERNAEITFYKETMPRLRDAFPDLKIVCEHITTETAVNFVIKSGHKTGATITPQHLLYTVGDLIQNLKYHLFCLPVVKFSKDKDALRDAVDNSANTRIFAGTDSAPHAVKVTECGCAAGCFTGGVAPQIYIQSFDLNKGHDNFKRFLCTNGADFYGLPVPKETFTLVREETPLSPLRSQDTDIIPLPLGLGQKTISWKIEL